MSHYWHKCNVTDVVYCLPQTVYTVCVIILEDGLSIQEKKKKMTLLCLYGSGVSQAPSLTQTVTPNYRLRWRNQTNVAKLKTLPDPSGEKMPNY